MNKERILELADHIETLEQIDNYVGWHPLYGKCDARHGFDMGVYKYGCGAPACVAGWAVHLFKPEVIETSVGDPDTYRMAQEALGLDPWNASALFLDRPHDEDEGDAMPSAYDITPEMAVRTLRNLAEWGFVEWK